MLKARLVQRLEGSDPIPFEEFMALALYDEELGYFATGPLRSTTTGDFLTSPEVSPLFGETIARFVDAELERCGGRAVVEVGSGSGSLLRPLLDGLETGVVAWAVEASAAARAATTGAVPEATVVTRIDDLPPSLRGVVVANEVADNLPVALAVRRGSGWMERFVGAADGELVYHEVAARPEVAAWADRHAGVVPQGGQVEVQLAAGAWLRSLLDLVEAGAVVVIDYGDDAEGLARRREEGTLRTYRGHHLGPDPLLEPGGTDVTVDVAFDALADVAATAGCQVDVTSQVEFLERWGLADRRRELREAELAAARVGETMARLVAKSRVTEADTLLHPRGLGAFRVLVARRG